MRPAAFAFADGRDRTALLERDLLGWRRRQCDRVRLCDLFPLARLLGSEGNGAVRLHARCRLAPALALGFVALAPLIPRATDDAQHGISSQIKRLGD